MGVGNALLRQSEGGLGGEAAFDAAMASSFERAMGMTNVEKAVAAWHERQRAVAEPVAEPGAEPVAEAQRDEA